MRKFLLGLLFLISVSVSAQIKEVSSNFEDIGKVGGGMSAFVSSMSVKKGNEKNNYLWMYNNLKYQTINDIKSITFTASEDEFNGLYDLLKGQLSAEKGTEKSLQIGNSTLNFTTVKNLGVSSLVITDLSKSGAFFYLNNKQLDKLFGK